MNPHHRSTRLLGSLLLVATGILAVGAAPVSDNVHAAAVTVPLGQVIPAPASVRPDGSPYRLTSATRIVVD
ncbi:MAG TPA: beta-N-acetylhexosaminidase, partial [Streptomyces sp.]|nr:beta-N-acetylhexosaminidase [Streptomyces sp.]